MNNRFLHYKTKAKFERDRNLIPSTSIAFIKDTKEIYTHGQLYNCESFQCATNQDIDTLFS